MKRTVETTDPVFPFGRCSSNKDCTNRATGYNGTDCTIANPAEAAIPFHSAWIDCFMIGVIILTLALQLFYQSFCTERHDNIFDIAGEHGFIYRKL